MKLWEVIPKTEDYGEVARLVVISETSESAIDFVSEHDYFESWQFPVVINEIEMNETIVVAMEGNDL